jgi:type I restriction enzyme, S subunit
LNLQISSEISSTIRRWKPYPAYKNSGLQWLGKIPEHWKVKRVKAITSTHKQGYYAEQAYVDDGVKLARITDIDDSANVSFDNMPFADVSSKDERAFAVEKGDFLFARSGTIGRFGLVLQPERSVFASYLIRFRFRECDPSFLRFAFSSHFFKESLISTLHGGANQNVHAENIKERFLAVPTPLEQRSIAGFLDRETVKIDALVAKKERLIELLREKRAALITRAVTKGLPSTGSGQATPNVPMKDSAVEWLGEIPAHWQVKRLKFLVSFYGGGTPSKDNLSYWIGDIPWVSPKDMNAELVTDSEEHITEEAVKSSATRLVQEGAVLLVVRSGILKHSIPVAINARGVALNQDMKALVPKLLIKAHYLKYLVAGHQEALLVEWRKAGATVESIEHDLLVNSYVPVPPVSEQVSIIDCLDNETTQIDALITKIREGIEKLKEYRTALISAAVTGKIDVREDVVA